jgi:hypothetical protein
VRLALGIYAIGCVDPTGPAQRPAGNVPADGPSVTVDDPPGTDGGLDVPLGPIVDQVVPLVGGGIAAGAEWIAAADPDSDAVRVVHTATRATQLLALELGSRPATVAWTSSSTGTERAHVLLRGNGGVAVVEPAASASETTPVLVHLAGICPMPRGLAWDDGRELMWVACAGGEIVGSTEDGTIVTTFQLDPDLRDIVVLEDGRAMVSRLRSAEVLIVDLDDGGVTARWTPREQTEPFERTFVPRMLRRMVPAASGGGALALYQAHDEGIVSLDEEDEDETAYGSSDHCGSIVRTVFSNVTADSGFDEPVIVDATAQGYVVDLVSSDAGWPVLAAPGGIVVWLERSDPVGDGETCVIPGGERALDAPAMPTGLARHGDLVWVATREPFMVGTADDLDQQGSGGYGRTGLNLFHAHAEAGIACASCHAEGGEDGHTWNFSTGARRTQPLGGIVISETAPFHWDGNLATFDHLFKDVGVGRMGLPSLDAEESLALQEFLDRLPRPPPAGPSADPAIVTEGAVLFGDATVGCTECHSGWRYSNGESADVGTGGTFQVPSLIGVAARLPLMHDGCAETLRERFDDLTCGGSTHGDTAHLSSDQIDALVAFLESL